jgi:hypothetical protein
VIVGTVNELDTSLKGVFPVTAYPDQFKLTLGRPEWVLPVVAPIMGAPPETTLPALALAAVTPVITIDPITTIVVSIKNFFTGTPSCRFSRLLRAS